MAFDWRKVVTEQIHALQELRDYAPTNLGDIFIDLCFADYPLSPNNWVDVFLRWPSEERFRIKHVKNIAFILSPDLMECLIYWSETKEPERLLQYYPPIAEALERCIQEVDMTLPHLETPQPQHRWDYAAHKWLCTNTPTSQCRKRFTEAIYNVESGPVHIMYDSLPLTVFDKALAMAEQCLQTETIVSHERYVLLSLFDMRRIGKEWSAKEVKQHVMAHYCKEAPASEVRRALGKLKQRGLIERDVTRKGSYRITSRGVSEALRITGR